MVVPSPRNVSYEMMKDAMADVLDGRKSYDTPGWEIMRNKAIKNGMGAKVLLGGQVRHRAHAIIF